MNLKLAEYISKWLAPKEYRLELKNRLENLCTLSGTPMSPGLHQWVTDKFGLEMTRVIEDYSTFTSPKLSPELLSVVDRIVPSKYQGEDVNLSFKQLFDIDCSCFYGFVIDSNSFGASNFTGFTIDGVDAITYLSGFVASNNGYGYGYDGGGYGSANSFFAVYESNAPVQFDLTDPSSNVYQIPFFTGKAVGCDDNSCLQAEIPAGTSLWWFSDLQTVFSVIPLGGTDVSDAATLQSYIQPFYPNVIVTSVPDDPISPSIYFLTFSNVYNWYAFDIYLYDLGFIETYIASPITCP